MYQGEPTLRCFLSALLLLFLRSRQAEDSAKPAFRSQKLQVVTSYDIVTIETGCCVHRRTCDGCVTVVTNRCELDRFHQRLHFIRVLRSVSRKHARATFLLTGCESPTHHCHVTLAEQQNCCSSARCRAQQDSVNPCKQKRAVTLSDCSISTDM